MLCVVCCIDIGDTHKYKKYCSVICRNKAAYAKTISNSKICNFCNVSFLGFIKQKFCSHKCSYDSRADVMNKYYQSKRKYPKIEGLNRCQIYRKFNPAKGREELSKDNMKRVIVIQALGGCCKTCGYTDDIRALQLDHINDDGYEDRRGKGKIGKIYRYYVNKLDEAKDILQVLCANCHAIKTSISREISKKKAKEYKDRKNASN
jgi:5-methylcytosine-specific restriction endonuclease McrA